MASISVPITVNLPDDWKEQILERIKQDDDWVCVVRCKDCKHRESTDCPMSFEEWQEIDEGDGYFDADYIIHDNTEDDGFCHKADMRGDSDE